MGREAFLGLEESVEGEWGEEGECPWEWGGVLQAGNLWGRRRYELTEADLSFLAGEGEGKGDTLGETNGDGVRDIFLAIIEAVDCKYFYWVLCQNSYCPIKL